MIAKIILTIGLVVIPFFSAAGYDTREPKFACAMVCALALSLWVISQGYIRKIANKWIYLLVGYLMIRCFISPKFLIVLRDLTVDSVWQWQPMCSILVFFLMFISIASLKFYRAEIQRIMSLISWVGVVMSIYAMLQLAGVDQYFKTVGLAKNELPDAYMMAGTLGQPTLLASFLAIIFPLSLYAKKYLASVIIFIALLLTQSHVAIIAAFISLLYVIGTNTRLRMIVSIFILSAMLVGGLYAIKHNNWKIPDSGRFATWKNIAREIKKNPITGLGIGSFRYIYHAKYPGYGTTSKMLEAHNDFLQVAYEAGLVGLALLLLAIWNIRKAANNKYLAAAFMASILCACGSFPWQLGAHIYYTVFIVGLIYAREVNGGQSSTNL